MTDVEVFAYETLERSRGGQHVRGGPGVIVIHHPTGWAAVNRDEPTQMKCKAAALAQLDEMLGCASKIAKLTGELAAALERLDWTHQRYLTEREINGALGEERDRLSAAREKAVRALEAAEYRYQGEILRMIPIVEAAERWADNTWPSYKAVNGEILTDAVTAYRKAKP